MSRVLAELLEANEPNLRIGLKRLERSNGDPKVDIRLSNEMQLQLHDKLKQLGLDPHDTTGPELYNALEQRLVRDEYLLSRALQKTTRTLTDPVALVAHGLRNLPLADHCFALKPSVAKRLLKAASPKRTMKTLGYRSVDSMLKHEPVALLYAAASISETTQWNQKLASSYKKLQPTDFEIRKVTIEQPTSQRWQTFSESVVAQQRHHIFRFTELAALVMLPLPAEKPPFATISTAVLALHAITDLQTASTFLKLQQVQTDFGTIVERLVTEEPVINASFFERAVPWHLVQRYYARRIDGQDVDSSIFEPHVQADDLVWRPIEAVLAHLEPSLAFWQGTAHLGFLHDSKPVSCNLTDALLSHCNKLPFEQRITHYFQKSLWHELMLRYFNHDKIEFALFSQLQPAVATISPYNEFEA
jgi:hypothetical protein